MSDFKTEWSADCPKCKTHITNAEFSCDNCGGNIKGKFYTINRVTSRYLGCDTCAEHFVRKIKCTNPDCGITINESFIKPKGGCFIATAVYGDYDASEVKTLRGFRDDHLQKSVIGRAVVRMYYKVSPPIANSLIRHPRATYMVRKVLDRIVNKIRSHQ